jgi:hypothetical protein
LVAVVDDHGVGVCVVVQVVDEGVAVVVDVVADLGRQGMDGVVQVVAVGVVRDAVFGRQTGLYGTVSGSVSIPVFVDVPDLEGKAFVDLTIAVIVLKVADLFGIDVRQGLVVIAVPRVLDATLGNPARVFGSAGVPISVPIDVGVGGDEVLLTDFCSRSAPDEQGEENGNGGPGVTCHASTLGDGTY